MSVSATTSGAVTARAPAKINLELVVGPRRDDGYHDLSTVFHAVSLYDDVTVEDAEDWSVEVRGPYAHLVPADGDNLALRAARELAVVLGVEDPVRVAIDKDIPVAAGLAGGSADAAAALVACDALWGTGAEPELLDDVAARLGSDVNFALTGGTAIGSGRGERVAPVLGRGRYHWVLVVAEQGLSTPTVFAECDRLRGDRPIRAPEPSEAMMQALRTADLNELAAVLDNDLQVAAFSIRPELERVLHAGLEYGALGGIVSGSGPTVVFLVDGNEGALDLAVALTASGTASEVKRAAGPVHGAHIVSGPSGAGGSGPFAGDRRGGGPGYPSHPSQGRARRAVGRDTPSNVQHLPRRAGEPDSHP